MGIVESFIRDKKIRDIPEFSTHECKQKTEVNGGCLKAYGICEICPNYQTEPTIKGYIRDTESVIYRNVYIH